MSAGENVVYGRPSLMLGLKNAEMHWFLSMVRLQRLTVQQRGQKSELSESINRLRGGRTSKVHTAIDKDKAAISGDHVHDCKRLTLD